MDDMNFWPGLWRSLLLLSNQITTTWLFCWSGFNFGYQGSSGVVVVELLLSFCLGWLLFPRPFPLFPFLLLPPLLLLVTSGIRRDLDFTNCCFRRLSNFPVGLKILKIADWLILWYFRLLAPRRWTSYSAGLSIIKSMSLELLSWRPATAWAANAAKVELMVLTPLSVWKTNSMFSGPYT